MTARFGSRGLKYVLLAATGVAIGLLPPSLRADHPTGALPGHSVNGDTFDEGPRRAATLVPGTGNVHFPISTKNADAQKFFDQGIGQLHGFWYLEAERTFRQVASLDPDCPMAYWGMAMANIKNTKRAKSFIAEAVSRQAKTELQPIETGLIGALSDFYKDEKIEQKQKRAFVDALGKLREQFPDDIELKAFSVFYIWEYKATDLNKSAAKLLDEVFAAAPNHPAHHYRIHMLDGKEAKGAIQSAALLGPAAPGVAHMWHMPGHTYSSLQRYADAAWQQEAAARVDHAYMTRDRVMPYEIHNYAHNNEWLIRDLLFVGRVGDAIDLGKNMVELPRHPKYNASSNRGSGAEYGRQRLLDTLSQHLMWPQFLDLLKTGYLTDDDGKDVDLKVRVLRYEGIAKASAGDAKAAEKCIEQLTALKTKPAPATRPSTRPATQPAQVASAASATTKPTTAPTTKPAVANGKGRRGAPEDRNTTIGRAIAHIQSELAAAAGDHAKAAKLLVAANARQEHISQAYLAAGDQTKAVELAKKAVDNGKGQTYPLANYVNVLFAAGKKDEARQQLAALQELASAVDLTVEPYKSVGEAAGELGCVGDWRLPRKAPGDLGERPAFDKLGPFRWHPSPAPQWTAPAADGSTLSLAQYQGKPVVVLFFLGHGCLHCTRQLHAFANMTKEFNDAGIELLAVSTDNPSSLNRAWEGAKFDVGEFPFPLVSDENLNIFKKYHCFDDFEKSPIHGTFLIDGKGLVRWQDISAEPFMDGQFLLKESQRLLKK